jgi:hypothetical protein
MALAAGALSKVLVGQSVANLSSAVATGGTGPYTYQWYESTTSGFTPGAGNIVTGQTALTASFSGLSGGTNYYFVVVATDTGNGNATANSAQLTVATEPSLSQNQFALQTIVGIVDMKVGPTNVMAAQVDVSVTTQIFAGQAVKIVANTNGGILKVAPISSKSDAAIGVAIFNFKDIQYVAGQNLEVAFFGTIVWQYATGAITQFAQVCLDPTYVGGVQATGNTATWIGWAYDGAASAGLIRVMLLQNAAYATA